MKEILERFSNNPKIKDLAIKSTKLNARLSLQGTAFSCRAFCIAAVANIAKEFNHLIILSNKEKAAYFLNDLEQIFEEQNLEYSQKHVLLYPCSYRKPYQDEQTDNANVLLRSEVLNRLNSKSQTIVVTYPKAMLEKVISKYNLTKNTLTLKMGDETSIDFIIDILDEYGFERVDFVSQAGEYALRGGIIDVFSFADEKPYRIEIFGESIESLRTFDIVSQLTIEKKETLTIVPNIEQETIAQIDRMAFADYFSSNTVLWIEDIDFCIKDIEEHYQEAQDIFSILENSSLHLKPQSLYCNSDEFKHSIMAHSLVEINSSTLVKEEDCISLSSVPQMSFNKNFALLTMNLADKTDEGYSNLFFVENPKQKERIEKIIKEFSSKEDKRQINIQYIQSSITEGFVCKDLALSCYTDHELFERYHKYNIRDNKQENQALTLKEITQLKPGDFITHIDYGVGKFAGLEKINNNGHEQETIRLVYKDNDILYVSIHALHKISRYTSKEGTEPTLNRLGSSAWQTLKNKTKQKVKDIAKDLIALYAKRKASNGFAFSADSYLQNELEASFIYEDTPDQEKATHDVKQDMEASMPMDRLVCGDVGFGKTEVAIRAAFKAVTDSKQVAVLVPTTILAYQHYKTFSERLQNMPCKVDYLNRFRSTKDKNQVLKDLKEGKIDILIGTHKILGKDVAFKDLGLLVIDEEHKFGVAMKEKLKNLKVNVDTLTLTATPIPRTLQFSLMGARDLSIINTPPLNRQPVYTEVCAFEEEKIRDSIMKELSRGGQVYFVYNRVQNIKEMAGMVQRLVPDANVVYAHGQMKGEELEDIMMRFIEGDFDVLVCTTIIENGLDIPNANTIIINDAQNYGLSDLHQLRGRVGRSNRKAYCYLFVPDMLILTDDARKRLKAIEDFSDIGSGFSIAMRDLDIRGAGNILGAEQSGFISDIGFDMYQKILNEAIEELKESDFKELYAQEKEEKQKRGESIYIAKECAIETDLEILIPDAYVTNIGERLSLYKEIDGLEKDSELYDLKARLEDRFGPVPKQTMELIDTIRLRRRAKELGFSKLVLKASRMVAHFSESENSEYFNSAIFGKILQYVQSYPLHIQLRQNPNDLSIVFTKIESIAEARNTLDKIG